MIVMKLVFRYIIMNFTLKFASAKIDKPLFYEMRNMAYILIEIITTHDGQ